MVEVEAGIVKRMRHRVGLAAPFPVADEAGQSPQRFLIEAQGFANLARRRFAAIGNDIRRHGRAQFAVSLIDILDGLLSLIFGRQIEIDVRPLAPALAQETLKQQLHAHRIDSRNFERIADGRVRRTAATLNQDVVALAELNDVPNDQEVSGKAELRNQSEFMLDLLFRSFQQMSDYSSARTGAARLLRLAFAESCPSSRLPAPDSAGIHSQDHPAANVRREESSTVFSMARGTSRKSAAISLRRAQMPLIVQS